MNTNQSWNPQQWPPVRWSIKLKHYLDPYFWICLKMSIAWQRLKVFFRFMILFLQKFRKCSGWNKGNHCSGSGHLELFITRTILFWYCYWVFGFFPFCINIWELQCGLRSIWNASVQLSQLKLSVKLIIFLDVASHLIINNIFWVTEKVRLSYMWI